MHSLIFWSQIWGDADSGQVITNASAAERAFSSCALPKVLAGQYSGVTKRNTILACRKYDSNHVLFWEQENGSHKLIRSALILTPNQNLIKTRSILESDDSKYLFFVFIGLNTKLVVINNKTLESIPDCFVWPGFWQPVISPTDSSSLVFYDIFSDRIQLMSFPQLQKKQIDDFVNKSK